VTIFFIQELALGIAVKSPQRKGFLQKTCARTWNGKPDHCWKLCSCF